MKTAKQLLEQYSEMGVGIADKDLIARAVDSLISQTHPQEQGIELVDISIEDEVVVVELLANNKPVVLKFMRSSESPLLMAQVGDSEDDYDISGLEPKVIGGEIDMESLDKWMPQELFQNIIFDQWTPAENEAMSVDQFERENESFATGVPDDPDIRDDKKKKKRKFKVNRVIRGGWGGYFPFSVATPPPPVDPPPDDDDQDDNNEEPPVDPPPEAPPEGGDQGRGEEG